MPVPGKRAKTLRGDATRRRIVEQSAAVFNQCGFAGTSISDLMTATGLEKGGIYRHFDSKQTLAAAAFDFAWEAVAKPREHGLNACRTSLEKLLLFIRNFVDGPPSSLPGGCPLLNTAVDSDDGNPLLRGKAREALKQWRSGFETIVCDGKKRGEFSAKVDPKAVAVIVISTLEGALMMSRLEGSRGPLRAAGRHLADYLQSLKVD